MAKKLTKYSKLQKTVAKRCKSPNATNNEKVKKAKAAYIKDAVTKGKSLAEAKRIAKKADTCNPFKK